MKYKIGEILEKHIQNTGQSFRAYATQHGVGEVDLLQIKNGHRGGSYDKLSKLIDIEMLREPMIDDIKENIDKLDTKDLITIYNSIYARVKKSAISTNKA